MIKYISIAILVLKIFCSFLLAQDIKEIPKYLNTELDFKIRAADLVDRMTLDEKISQTVMNSAAVKRLGVDAYDWWSEALHGVARSGRATVFPQAIGLGATFDPELLKKIGQAISDEARAINNHILDSGKEQTRYQGLTFWSPNVNIFRDPRWGRGQETYGEDPYLTGTLGAAFINGMQGDHPKYLKVAACAKHFAVHSGPEALRNEFNAIVSPKDLRETYLPAFKKCIDAGVEAIMCAYNRTNDEACCGSNLLLQDILLNEWKYDGHILSDCWALENFHNHHGLTSNHAESASLALSRGVHLNCGITYAKGLKSAIDMGLVTEQKLDESLKHLFCTRFKLGMFDNPDDVPYRKIGINVINNDEKQRLALEAAHKSIVLLKNDNALPLDPNSKFIYMTGPLAANVLSLVGNYNGLNSNMQTIVEGVMDRISPSTRMQYRQGSLLTSKNLNNMDWFSGMASDAEATIVVLGLTLLLEGEEGESIASAHKGDILDMKLPESQLILLRKISEVAKAGNKKIITIICAGMPLDLREVSKLSDAIIYAWYPGERGGDAIADIVFGDVSPSGKLPITFPKSVEQLPQYEDYSMQGRTYKFMTKKPLYPFGFGLSYGSLEWESPLISDTMISSNEELEVEIVLNNNGPLDIDEIVQVYMNVENISEEMPNYSLIDFMRIKILSGKTKKLKFSIPYKDFTYYNKLGEHLQYKGKAKIIISNASPGDRSKELGAKQFTIPVLID